MVWKKLDRIKRELMKPNRIKVGQMEKDPVIKMVMVEGVD